MSTHPNLLQVISEINERTFVDLSTIINTKDDIVVMLKNLLKNRKLVGYLIVEKSAPWLKIFLSHMKSSTAEILFYFGDDYYYCEFKDLHTNTLRNQIDDSKIGNKECMICCGEFSNLYCCPQCGYSICYDCSSKITKCPQRCPQPLVYKSH